MAIDNANSHPYQVEIVGADDNSFYANSHPYKVAIVGGHAGIEARIVDELPETGETGYIYLVLKETTSEGDVYDEYMWVLQQDGETYGWEHLGATNEVAITLYGSTGQNTDGAMTQKAVTDTMFHNNDTSKIQIGTDAISTGDTHYSSVAIGRSAEATGGNTVAIGFNSKARGSGSVTLGYVAQATRQGSVAIGHSSGAEGVGSIAIGGYSGTGDRAYTARKGSIALGVGATAAADGEVNIGDRTGGYGYNSSKYRLLSGLHDGQNDHDAVTVGQLNTAIAEVEVAEINSTDWSALWQ